MNKHRWIVFALILFFVSAPNIASDALAARTPPKTTIYNPWCHTFHKPYRQIFIKTKNALIFGKKYKFNIFDLSMKDHFIYGIEKGSSYMNVVIRFEEVNKNETKVIIRCPTSKTSLYFLRMVGDLIGEPLPTRTPVRGSRKNATRILLYSADDMSKECKPYMEHINR